MFWSLWDQSSGGSWTLQGAAHGFELVRDSAAARSGADGESDFHPALYSARELRPLSADGRFFTLTPLRKIGIGLFLTAFSYVVIWYIQQMIDGGGKPSVNWQFLAYAILTLGEAMVSITGLEFSYTQAPNKMKSAVMALWLFTVSLGNHFTAGLNYFIRILTALEDERSSITCSSRT